MNSVFFCYLFNIFYLYIVNVMYHEQTVVINVNCHHSYRCTHYYNY